MPARWVSRGGWHPPAGRPGPGDGAGDPARAEELYEYFCTLVRRDFPHAQTGEFGADMKVALVNDGPFSIWLDTDEL